MASNGGAAMDRKIESSNGWSVFGVQAKGKAEMDRAVRDWNREEWAGEAESEWMGYEMSGNERIG